MSLQGRREKSVVLRDKQKSERDAVPSGCEFCPLGEMSRADQVNELIHKLFAWLEDALKCQGSRDQIGESPHGIPTEKRPGRCGNHDCMVSVRHRDPPYGWRLGTKTPQSIGFGFRGNHATGD